MKTIGRVYIIIFNCITCYHIKYSKIHENFTTEEFIKESELLNETNEKILTTKKK